MAEEKFVIGVDCSEALTAAEQTTKAFDDVGKAAERNSKIIDKNYFGKDVLASLDGITKILVNSFGELIDAQKETTKALVEYKGNVKKVSSEENAYAKSLAGVKQELRATTNELTDLTVKYRRLSEEEKRSVEGKSMLDTIEELTQKAGELRDAMDDASKSIRGTASDTWKMDAVTQGLNVAASAAGAFAGALGMVGVSEEAQQEIQTKLQASLAISNALTVTQAALQKESALMIGITAAQRKAEAIATNIATAAQGKNVIVTKAATVAQAAFNLVAKANPYVLIATSIISVVGAFALFSRGAKKQKQSIEEIAEAQKKAAEAQKEYYKLMTEGAGNVIAKYNALVLSYKNLKSTAEKTQWIKDNKSAFDALGVSINNINDAEKAFLQNTEEMIRTFRLRTKLAALEKLAAEETQRAESQRMADANAGGLGNGTYNLYDISAEGYTKKYVEVQAEVDKLQKQLGVFKKDTIVNREKSNLSTMQDELTEAYQKMIANVRQSEITAMQEGTANTLEQMEFDREQRLAEVKKIEKDYLKRKQEIAKQEYIKNGGNADNFDNSKVTLSTDETALIQALRNGVLIEYSNIMDEVLEKERQNVAEREKIQREAMNVYLEQYGTFNQQIQAIKDLYDEDIKKAETEGEKLRLIAERDVKIKDKQREQDEKADEQNRKVISSTRNLIGAINGLGNAIGGTSGELVNLAVSAGNTIVSTIEGLEAASKASSTAIQTIEKASLILMAISTAIQIATKIADMFSSDKGKEEQIERLQKKVKGLQREYNNLQKVVDKTYSSDRSLKINEQIENKQKQIIALQQQINEEASKKKVDNGRIEDWQDSIKNIEDELADLREAAKDAIFGEDINGAIERFADAYVGAWEAGESKIRSAKDFAKNTVKQMLTESIKATIQNSGDLAKIRTMVNQFMTDGIMSAWEGEQLDKAAEELSNKLDKQYGGFDRYFKETSSQDKSGGGFATASQDSIDELNGRFTAVQMNTNSLANSVNEINNLATAQVQHLAQIRLQTEQSVNLGMEAVTSLASIEKNTRELYSMNERLANIERNTSRI